MKKLYLLFIFLLLVSFKLTAQVETNETFEVTANAPDGSSSFTSNGQLFTITNQVGNAVVAVTSPPPDSYGWNGSAPDKRYFENSNPSLAVNPKFTISSLLPFKIKSFWLFLSDISVNQFGDGQGRQVTVVAKNGTTEVFTYVKSSDFLTGSPSTVNNGFVLLDFTSILASANPITSIEVTMAGTNFNYFNLDAFRWVSIPTATPTITTSGTLTAFSSCAGSVSTSQSFNVSGSDLTANVAVATPTGYEVSLSSTTGYATSINIPFGTGTITNVPVYVRLTSGAIGSPAGNITLNSTGATQKTVSVNGTVSTNPTITAQPSASSICAGANTTFTSGATGSTGTVWQVNTGSTWNDLTNTAPYTGVTTNTLTITGATAGMNGYQYRMKAVNGACQSFSNAATLTISTNAVITSNPPTRNVCTGANTTFTVAATNATGYKWQVSTDGGNIFNDIADGGIYSNTETTILNITGATSAVNGNRYRCRVTGGCGFVNSNSAILNVSTIVIGQSQTNVTTFGGGNGTATATASGGIGVYTYSWSPSDGTSATATGLSAGTYTVTVKDVLNCEATATYVITQPAGVSTSLSTLPAFGSCSGTASADKTFTVNGGAGLTADVVVTAPTGYEVSLTSGSGYNSSVTITQSGGVIASTPVYVRMSALASGSMSGNVTVSSTGVTSKNVTVTGLASNLSASSYTASDVSCFGGSNGTIDLTPSGGKTPYTYNWGTVTTQDRTGLPAGTYSVTITDGNNCTYTISNIAIQQPTAALNVATGGGQTDVSCFGGANGTATVAPTGGTSAYSYSWNTTPVQTTATATGLTAGTYTVTVTDAKGCQATRSFTIIQPTAALSAATGGGKTDVSCFGGANGTATVAPTGGTTSYTYSWDTTPVQNTATATGLSVGTYTVTVTDFNGCQAFRSFTIGQPAAALTTTQGTVNNTSCFGGSNGSAQVIASGGTTPYTYSWSPSGGASATASGLAAGTYTVTVTDNRSCQATQSFTITQPATAVDATYTKTDISCNGGSNGAIDITPSGGTPPYTYSWGGGINTQDRTNIPAGTYSVTVFDANGCSKTISNISITQPATAVNATALAQTNIACRGAATGSATVTASGGTGAYNYSWAPSGGTAATASNLAAGTYTVTVTDTNGCLDTQSFTLTQPAAVLSTTAGTINNVSCNGGANGTAQVIASGGTTPYSYSWSPFGGTGATASGLVAGTYTVTVTDAYGCQATRDFTITQPAALVAAFGSQTNVSCNGGANGSATVNVTGGTPGYTYSWSPYGGTVATANGLVAGTYTVTVTDNKNCQTTQSFTINQPTALTSTISKTDVLCNGGSTGTATVTPTGGNGGYTYIWSPSGGTAATASGLVVGNYECLITDSKGCSITKNITINQPSALGATTAQTNATCAAGGTASVTPFGGVGGYTYLWTPGGATTQSVSNLPAGNHSCLITDAYGCTVTKNFTITSSNTLVASTFQTNLLCNGINTGSAGVIPTGAPGPYTYVWSPSGGNADTATNLAAGTYSVLITASNGCSITKNFTITQPTALVASAGAQTNVSCNGGTNGSATVAVTGGTGAYTYAWAPTGGSNATANGLAAGTYTVTVKDANLCQTTQSFTITQPTTLVTSVGAQTNVSCNGGTNGSATVAVTGGTGAYTYAWAPTGGTGATANGLAAGTYTVTVKDANLCQTTQSITITQPTVLTASAGAQTNVSCNGGNNGSATVSVTGGTGAYTYVWAPSGGTAATATGLAAGTYTVTVKDANLCETTQTFTITQPTVLVATAAAQTNLLCNGGTTGSATVSVTGGTGAYTYLWAPSGGTAATATGLAAGTYTVTVKDANLCQTTQSFTITQPTALVATAGAQTNVGCNGGNNGSATVNVTGGTGAYTYIWAPSGGTAATATGLAAGTYTVTVKDANLCQTTQSFTITQPAPIPATITAQTNVSCFGGTNGSATAAITGGTSTYTYSWNTIPVQTTATATGLAAGNYTVTITDTASGCIATATATITQPTVLVANGTSSNISCHGAANGTASVMVSGGTPPYTYSWNTTPVQTTATATQLSGGTYIATVTDANGCVKTRSFTIYEQAPIVVVTSAQTNLLCNGATNGSATLTVTGGVPAYTYQWAPYGGNQATATGLGEGTYTVTITDALSCSTSHTVTITAPTALVLTTDQHNISCNGAGDGSYEVNVSGGVGPYTYTWVPDISETNAAENLAVGNYSVTVTDANGCTALRNFSITQPLPLAITNINSTNVSCHGGNDGTAEVTVSGGTTPYTYEWSPMLDDVEGSEFSVTGLEAGTYTVNITDANGCVATQNIIITQPVAINITAQPQDESVTTNENASFSVTATNVNTYQWQVSQDGENWTDVSNGGTSPAYAGATSATLIIANVPLDYNNYLYRVLLVNGIDCVTESAEAILTVSNLIVAVDDDFSDNTLIEGTGGIAGDVTENDLFNNLPVNDTDVTISVVDNDGLLGVTVDSDGNIIVPDTAVPGNYTITYSICDTYDLTNCSTAEANVVVTELVGRDEFNATKLTIYPNPASTEVFVKVGSYADYGNMNIAVYDLNGRLVRESAMNAEQQRVEVTGLESGVYIFTVTTDKGQASKRVIINKTF